MELDGPAGGVGPVGRGELRQAVVELCGQLSGRRPAEQGDHGEGDAEFGVDAGAQFHGQQGVEPQVAEAFGGVDAVGGGAQDGGGEGGEAVGDQGAAGLLVGGTEGVEEAVALGGGRGRGGPPRPGR
ncbi:hypothetical protein SCYAM73S_01316 [Streptomyces cyaneofuscatus]